MADEWEDVSYGPAASSSSDGWEDVAYGPATAPQAAPLGGAETFAGGMSDLLNKATFGFGDEATSGVNSVLDYLLPQSLGGTGQSVSDAYNSRLEQTRDLTSRYQQEHPYASFANNAIAFGMPLPGGGKLLSQAPGILPAIGNVAKTSVLGAGMAGLYGFGEGEGGLANRLQGVAESAPMGALLGGGLGILGEGLSGVSNKLSRTAGNIEKELVGYNPELKSKIAGFLDSEGNLTRNATEAVSQVSKKDLSLRDLKDSGFFDTIKVTDNPSSVALKLSQFKQTAGETIGSVVDDAAKLEKSIMSEQAPWQNAEMLKAESPSFKAAQDYAATIKEAEPMVGNKLEKRISRIANSWESSDQSMGALKNIQEKFGLINQKSFGPKTAIETYSDTLNNKIYGALAESVKGRIQTLGELGGKPELGDTFSAANKAYASSATFENSAFNAARKSGVGKAVKDLFSGFGGVGKTALAYASQGTPLGPLFAAERAATVAKDIFPVQARKAAQLLSGGTGKLSPKIIKALPAGAAIISEGNQPTQRTLPLQEKSSTSSLNSDRDFIGSKVKSAEDKLIMETPKVVSVSRIGKKLKEEDLSPLVKAVISQESSGKADAVSSKGAQGLMQIMPATGKEIAQELGVKKYDLKDPETNKKFGEYYLKKMLALFDGDLELALTAYNQGPNRVKNLLKIHDATTLKEIKPHLGPDGRAYASSIISKLKKSGITLA